MTPNPLLAALYAGKEKTAAEPGEQIDLTKITAAEFITGLNDGTIVMPEADAEPAAAAEPEKTSSEEDVDLTKLTGRQLLELYTEAEEAKEKTAQENELKKLAESGELAKYDLAGRIMAHALNDELSKLAAAASPAEEPERISVDDINGKQLVEMLNSGEWELVGGEAGETKLPFAGSEPEKTAASVGEAAGAVHGKVKQLGEYLLKRTTGAGRAALKAEKTPGIHQTGEMKIDLRGFKPSERAKALAGYGTAAGGTLLTAAGAKALLGKKKPE